MKKVLLFLTLIFSASTSFCVTEQEVTEMAEQLHKIAQEGLTLTVKMTTDGEITNPEILKVFNEDEKKAFEKIGKMLKETKEKAKELGYIK
jgi:hypothetical protein